MPERNPFEETRQAAQNWSPREQYISRSNQPPRAAKQALYPAAGGNVEGINWRNYIGPDIRVGGGPGIGNIERANMNIPWRMPPGPGEGRIIPKNPALPPWHRGNLDGGEGSFWNVRADQPWDNSGIMAADAGNIRNKYKQFTDTFGDFDIGRGGIEYEKDFDIPWGGTGTFEGWGGGDDYGVGINFNWPLGQSAALDGGIGSTDEYQMAKALDPDVALNILGDPNRNMDSILQIYGDDAWDNLPSFKIGDKWYGNPALGMPGRMGSGWST